MRHQLVVAEHPFQSDHIYFYIESIKASDVLTGFFVLNRIDILSECYYFLIYLMIFAN